MARESLEEVIPFISKGEEFDPLVEAELSPPRHHSWRVTRFGDNVNLQRLGRACVRTFRSLLWIVLPSYLQHHETPSQPVRVRPTAYLDSLRGVAAFLVLIHHYTYIAWEENEGFGSGDDPTRNRYIMQLPVIRLIHTGGPMVAIFFVISGFVLSIKPLRLIREIQSGDRSATADDTAYSLLRNVSGSLIGRWFRLFVPTLVSTLAIVAMLQLLWYQSTRKMSEDKKLLAGDWEDQPVQRENLYRELQKWVWAWAKFSHSYNESINYDEHLWTISLEWQCSLRLYLTLLATSCMTSRTRLASLVVFITWAWGWGHWELVEFWTGMIMAEWRLRQEGQLREKLEMSSKSRTHAVKSWFCRHAKIWWSINLLCGLYLMSYPPVSSKKAKTTPGYMTLADLMLSGGDERDRYRFWHAIGAAQCIASIGSIEEIRTLFSTRPLRYLGDISFPLYLVHGPIIHTFGYNMIRLSWKHITGGFDSMKTYSWGFVFAALPTLPVVLYMADRFTDWVDRPAIRLSKWVSSSVVRDRSDS